MGKTLACLVILAAWGLSLVLPVADTSGGQTSTGWDIVKIWWMGPLMGQSGWFANLMIIPALGLAAGQYGDAIRAKGIVGAILSLLVINSAFWSVIPSAAGEVPIARFLLGYWLWMTSLAAAGLWLLAMAFKLGVEPREEPDGERRTE